MSSIRIFSPATVANIGPGYDVLGLALDVPGDEMVVRTTDEPGIRITKIEGAEIPFEAAENVAGVSLMAFMEASDYTGGFEMEIYKGIKPGSGVGSSAASAAGSVFAANEILGRPFSKAELVPFAMQGEKLVSGVAHADNVAPALLGNITLVRQNDPLDVVVIPAPDSLYVTVIHPQIEVKTSESRRVLPKDVPLSSAVQQWGNVSALVAGFYTSDYALIGRALSDGIVEPVRSKLIPGFDQVKAAALAAGALGGSISGSGPSIFAFTTSAEEAEEVKSAMENAYSSVGPDYATYVGKVNPVGCRVLG